MAEQTTTMMPPTTPTEAKVKAGKQALKDAKKKDDKKKDDKSESKKKTQAMTKPRPTCPEPRKDPAPVHKREKKARAVTIPPKIWAKISYLRDRGSTEVSMMAISDPDDPFRIIDVRMVKQWGISTFTEFEDKALANFVEDMVVDEKIPPNRCMRIWLHTHPGMSPSPSGHDESTFERVNADASYGIMIIVANETEYCRLTVNNGEGMTAQRELKVHLDLYTPHEGVTEEDYEAWEKEYCENLRYGTIPTAKDQQPSAVQYNYCGGRGMEWDEQAWGGAQYEDSDDDDEDKSPDPYITKPETILSMREEVDGFFYVYSDNWWLQYGAEEEVELAEGSKFEESSDISRFDPHDWGSLVWCEDGPYLYTKYGDEHDLNELKAEAAEEEAALAEFMDESPAEGDDEQREDADQGSEHPAA